MYHLGSTVDDCCVAPCDVIDRWVS